MGTSLSNYFLTYIILLPNTEGVCERKKRKVGESVLLPQGKLEYCRVYFTITLPSLHRQKAEEKHLGEKLSSFDS